MSRRLRSVQQEWDILGPGRESICGRHTYERAQPGSRLYRLCGLQVLLSPWGTGFLWARPESSIRYDQDPTTGCPREWRASAPQLCGS